MSNPKPWPFTGIDFHVSETGYVECDDGRKFVATVHEKRLWERLEEIAYVVRLKRAFIAAGNEVTEDEKLEPGVVLEAKNRWP